MRPDHWIQLTDLAAEQHGLVTGAQIAATGAGRRTVTRAVAAGFLRRVRPSVFVVAGAPPSVWQPLMAASLAAGTGAVASHRAAGGLHGLAGILPGAVELTVPGPALRLAGARCHTTEFLDHTDVVRVGGFEATSAVRTIIDLAGSVHPALLSTMVGEASRRRLCSDAALGRRLAEIGGRGRPGTAALRAVLAAREGGDSGLEDRWLRELAGRGLRPPALQHQVVVGPRVLVLDFAWPAERVGVEVDGWVVHRERAVWDRDHDKVNAYAEAGWTVLFVTSRTPPADVARQLRQFISRSRATTWRAVAR